MRSTCIAHARRLGLSTAAVSTPNPSVFAHSVACRRSRAPLLCCILQRRIYIAPTAIRPEQAAPPHSIKHATPSPRSTLAQLSPSRAERAVSSWRRAFSSSLRFCDAKPWAALRSSGGRRGADRRIHDTSPTPSAVEHTSSHSLLLPHVPAVSPPAATQNVPEPALLPRPVCL